MTTASTIPAYTPVPTSCITGESPHCGCAVCENGTDWEKRVEFCEWKYEMTRSDAQGKVDLEDQEAFAAQVEWDNLPH